MHVGAVEDAAAEGQIAVAPLLLERRNELVLERREGGERLEGRARMEDARHRLVEHRAKRIGVELVEGLADPLLAGPAGEIVRIEVGLRVEREEATGANV